MTRSRTYRLTLLTGLVSLGGLGFSGAASASLGGPCLVPVAATPAKATQWLEHCVAQVNGGGPLAPNEIVFEGAQTYELDAPLELRRDVVIHGDEQIVRARAGFTGDSLFVVGSACPGAGCLDPVDVTIEGMELTAPYASDVRGVLLRSDNSLTLDGVHLHELRSASSGGCVRAESESTLFVFDSTLEECTSGADGGALFSEASVTAIVGTRISDSVAGRTKPDSAAQGAGGGIYVPSNPTSARKLNLWDTTVEGNEAAEGGGIKVGGDNVNAQITESTLQGNIAARTGGGFYGGATIVRSLLSDNSAGERGGGAYIDTNAEIRESTVRANHAWRGGGLYIRPDDFEDVDIIQTTLEANTTLNSALGVTWGSGVFVRGTNPAMQTTTFSNCTFSENGSTSVNARGGGLAASRVDVVIEHSTFYNNESRFGRSLYTPTVGNTYLTLNSSIIANTNTSAPGNACDILGPAPFQTTTSIDIDGSCNVEFSNDPGLAPLTNNGGPTETHLPTAVDVFKTATCFSNVDQRGVARPGSLCDIGSVQQ